MHILIATDKFKGSLSAAVAAGAMAAGARQVFPGAQITVGALSDGGEGFCDAVHRYAGTESITIPATDPLGRPVMASYEWEAASGTAWIELSEASGLARLKSGEYDPLSASTSGTGILVRDAVRRGAVKVVLGLGGSATCDGGMGILSELELQFFDRKGFLLEPCGKNLERVYTVQGADNLPVLEWVLAVDVWNPLFGKEGAAEVFAPQKGADPAAVRVLDQGLRHWADAIRNWLGRSVDHLPGAGAAGGVAAGIAGWYAPEIRSGASIIMELAGISRTMQQVQLVITGEGRLDAQTGQGKLVHAVAAMARENGIPVIACCGQLDLTAAEVAGMGIDCADSLAERGLSVNTSPEILTATLRDLTASCIRKLFPG